jgi:hypothetical protein
MVFSIISVTTDAILAAARNYAEKIGSAEKNGVGREPEPQVFFLRLSKKYSRILLVIPSLIISFILQQDETILRLK